MGRNRTGSRLLDCNRLGARVQCGDIRYEEQFRRGVPNFSMRADSPAMDCAVTALAASESGAASGARGPTSASHERAGHGMMPRRGIDLYEFAAFDAAPDQPGDSIGKRGSVFQTRGIDLRFAGLGDQRVGQPAGRASPGSKRGRSRRPGIRDADPLEPRRSRRPPPPRARNQPEHLRIQGSALNRSSGTRCPLPRPPRAAIRAIWASFHPLPAPRRPARRPESASLVSTS